MHTTVQMSQVSITEKGEIHIKHMFLLFVHKRIIVQIRRCVVHFFSVYTWIFLYGCFNIIQRVIFHCVTSTCTILTVKGLRSCYRATLAGMLKFWTQKTFISQKEKTSTSGGPPGYFFPREIFCSEDKWPCPSWRCIYVVLHAFH
jgi:hypothetical protein